MSALQSLFNSPGTIRIANWLLIALAIWMTSQFVWSFWPQPSAPVKTTPNQSIKKVSFNLNRVLSADLFGKAESTRSQPEQITAPVSRLKLKLRGVYATEDELASAMIEHNRKQEVYRTGGKLPGASGLTLYRVLPDRVIMSRNGKYETLYIEDFDGSTPSRSTSLNSRPRPERQTKPDVAVQESSGQTTGDRTVIDKRTDAMVTQQLVELRQNLTDPAAITDLVTLSPVSDDGEFKGFRLAPGKNRALFGRLGLRRNDIVTEVNGITMSDPTASFNIMEQFSTADEISLTIKRGDRDMVVMLSAVPQ